MYAIPSAYGTDPFTGGESGYHFTRLLQPVSPVRRCYCSTCCNWNDPVSDPTTCLSGKKVLLLYRSNLLPLKTSNDPQYQMQYQTTPVLDSILSALGDLTEPRGGS